MSSEQTNTMIDYARLYDMSQAEINLFYKKNEEELIEMIEGTFSKEIGTLRSLLVNIRKKKTDIKSLRLSLENPIEYFDNLVENIHSESESNIKSLKVTIKKVNSILDTLRRTQEEIRHTSFVNGESGVLSLGCAVKSGETQSEIDFIPEKDSPIGRVFAEQIDFMTQRLEYYEKAMVKYQSYVDYSRENKILKKKSPEEFEKKAIDYCIEFSKVLDMEEIALKADEETYRAQLEEWRRDRYLFQDKYEKQIMKSME